VALKHEADPTAGLGDSPRRLDERYELVERIGAGGMAEVWRARDTRLDREVAVKILHTEAGRDAARRRRVEREARALAAADHPNIVSVFDYGEATDEGGDVVPYLVMELVDGSDLDRFVSERGPLPIEDAREMLVSILAAVTRAHAAGVVHGDIKPANIYIGPHGPKVGDFGVARIMDEETGNTTIAATPTFAAPEVLKGERATAASDVYSVGCVGFELLTGRPPFEGANSWEIAAKHIDSTPPRLRKLRSDVPPGLDAAIVRAMDKNPKRRFGDAASFAAAIGVIADVAPSDATVQVAPPAPAGPEPTQVLTGRAPDPGHVAVLGPFAGLWGRISAGGRRVVARSPNARVLLLLLIPLLLLFAFLVMRDPGTPTTAVPDVVGEEYKAAIAELQEAGFKVDLSYRPVTGVKRAGTVLDTIPGPEQSVAAGSKIHVVAGALAPTPQPTVQSTGGGGGGDDDDGGGGGGGKRKGKRKRDD
jgi:eukaryotic-like serine/threonine-protein kinase